MPVTEYLVSRTNSKVSCGDERWMDGRTGQTYFTMRFSLLVLFWHFGRRGEKTGSTRIYQRHRPFPTLSFFYHLKSRLIQSSTFHYSIFNIPLLLSITLSQSHQPCRRHFAFINYLSFLFPPHLPALSVSTQVHVEI